MAGETGDDAGEEALPAWIEWRNAIGGLYSGYRTGFMIITGISVSESRISMSRALTLGLASAGTLLPLLYSG